MVARVALALCGFAASLVHLSLVGRLRPFVAPAGAPLGLSWDLPVCPADCPAPSLAFCAGPVLDYAERLLEQRLVSPVVLVCGAAALLAAGFLLGRWSAPLASQTVAVRRPYGA